MPVPLPTTVRSKVVRLLLLHWRPDAIAEAVNCSQSTVYCMQQNLFVYGSVRRPRLRTPGPLRAISKAAKDSLIEWLKEEPWAMQKEMV